MTNLYETLGVAKDATAAAIKKAFRDKVKKHHPDTGGDAEQFHALVRANDVLSDEDKRRRYDETGTIDDKPDPIDSNATHIIAQFVERFVSDPEAKFKHLVRDLKNTINEEIGQAKGSIKEGRDYEKRVVDLRKRVKGDKGGALIGSMMDSQIRQCQGAIKQLEQQIDIRKRALEMIDDADFTVEVKPATSNGFYSIAEEDIMRMARDQIYGQMNSVFKRGSFT